MASDSVASSDPFSDHAAVDGTSVRQRNTVWQVNQHITLALTANELVVQGTADLADSDLPTLTHLADNLERESSSVLCCNILPKSAWSRPVSRLVANIKKANSTPKSIPYFNILWAETTKTEITIHYAEPKSSSPQSSVRVRVLLYLLQATSTFDEAFAARWTAELLDHSYGSSQRKKRMKILLNPRGGKGRAVKIYT